MAQRKVETLEEIVNRKKKRRALLTKQSMNSVGIQDIENELPISETNDGETHIRIYSLANTELGRKLHLMYCGTPVVCPELGNFASIAGAMYFHDIKLDVYRDYSFITKDRFPFSKTPKASESIVRFAKRLILSVLEQDAELKKLFVESSLPFKEYTVLNSMSEEQRIFHTGAVWYLNVLEEIRYELQNA